MNSYADYFGADTPGRRARTPVNVVIGDAIGSMVAATVFGLTRAVTDFDSAAHEGAVAPLPDR